MILSDQAEVSNPERSTFWIDKQRFETSSLTFVNFDVRS